MADVNYTKKTWANGSSGGTPITAEELNRMENGIADCAAAANDLGDSISQMMKVLVLPGSVTVPANSIGIADIDFSTAANGYTILGVIGASTWDSNTVIQGAYMQSDTVARVECRSLRTSTITINPRAWVLAMKTT